ncbi:hypothetical protein JOM56_014383 [Amanita muscaria]
MPYLSETAELPYSSHPSTPLHPHILGAPHPWGTMGPDNMAPEHNDFSSTNFGDIDAQGLVQFDENGFLQPDELWSLVIPSNEEPGPSTSSTATDLSAPSPLGPSAPELHVIYIEPAEADLKTVGSPAIQQAAGKRRKKKGSFNCQFRNLGCNATFTARHNLRYHLNSHRGEKPYKCNKGCSYAAASPATMKRHQGSCKAEGNP